LGQRGWPEAVRNGGGAIGLRWCKEGDETDGSGPLVSGGGEGDSARKAQFQRKSVFPSRRQGLTGRLGLKRWWQLAKGERAGATY
jgi:hypothetical protein